MQTIGKYIDEVQSRYSKGVKSTDSRLTNRLIYSKLLSMRAKLITEKVNKKQILSNSFYQLLSGVEMEQVTTSMLSTISISNNIMRSKNQIPIPIYNIDKPLVKSCSNIEGSVIYNLTTWETVKNASGRKYTGDKPNYFLMDNYLFITGKASPRAIGINYVADDPIAAYLFPKFEDCTQTCIGYLDIPFPIDEDMGNTLIEMTTTHLLNIYSKRKDDREQDDIDNT